MVHNILYKVVVLNKNRIRIADELKVNKNEFKTSNKMKKTDCLTNIWQKIATSMGSFLHSLTIRSEGPEENEEKN